MTQLIVQGTRFKPLNTKENPVLQIGKPEEGNLVTSFIIENQGRNSLMKIRDASGALYFELRPGDPAFTGGAEFPCVLRTTFWITFEEENQQQYAADGTQPPVDPAKTNPSQKDALVHQGVLVEHFIMKDFQACHI